MTASIRSDPLQHPAFLWLRELLWPEEASDSGRRYAVLTRRRRPRLVVPLDSPEVLAGALGRTSADVSRRHASLRAAAALAARRGVLRPLLRTRFDAGTPAGSAGIETWLAEALGEERVDIVTTIGPPRPNRKPVLQLFAPTGETIGYAKIGWNGLTRGLVVHEAEVLGELAAIDATRIIPPRLLHLGRWRDLDVSVLSPLPPDDARPVRRDPAQGDLAELASLGERHRSAFAGSSYAAELMTRIDVLEHPSAGAYGDVLGALTTRWGPVELEFGFSHGDWAPWNMVADADHLFVWDWERARRDVPVLVDAAHYTFQRAWLRQRRTPADATTATVAATQRHADSFALSDDAVDLIVRLYLLELCLRYAENAGAGTDELRESRHAAAEAELLRIV